MDGPEAARIQGEQHPVVGSCDGRACSAWTRQTCGALSTIRMNPRGSRVNSIRRGAHISRPNRPEAPGRGRPVESLSLPGQVCHMQSLSTNIGGRCGGQTRSTWTQRSRGSLSTFRMNPRGSRATGIRRGARWWTGREHLDAADLWSNLNHPHEAARLQGEQHPAGSLCGGRAGSTWTRQTCGGLSPTAQNPRSRMGSM